jgi:hypothetical protein
MGVALSATIGLASGSTASDLASIASVVKCCLHDQPLEQVPSYNQLVNCLR